MVSPPHQPITFQLYDDAPPAPCKGPKDGPRLFYQLGACNVDGKNSFLITCRAVPSSSNASATQYDFKTTNCSGQPTSNYTTTFINGVCSFASGSDYQIVLCA